MIWWKIILVFINAMGVNFFYGLYVKNISDSKFLRAAIFGEVVTVLIALNLIQFVKNQWYLIPAIVGGFIGTMLVRHFTKKKVVYLFKDKPYEILYESQFKLNGVWTDCIIYKCLYKNPHGKIWVRTKTEFFELFKIKK